MTGDTPDGAGTERGAGGEGKTRPAGSAWTLDGPRITADAKGNGGTRVKRPRGVIAFVLVIALLAVAAIAAGSYVLLRTKGSPGETAARYLSAWQRGNVAAMRELSVGVPAGGLAGPLAQVDRDLGVRGRQLRLGAVAGGQPAHRACQLHRHADPGGRRALDVSGQAAVAAPQPPLVGELESRGHLPAADAGRTVPHLGGLAGPGTGARCRWHPAGLAAGDRGIRLGADADRDHRPGDLSAAQAARRAVPHRRHRRPGRHRAGVRAAPGRHTAHVDRTGERAAMSSRRSRTSVGTRAPRCGPASTCGSSRQPRARSPR